MKALFLRKTYTFSFLTYVILPPFQNINKNHFLGSFI